jgi:septum formation protein
MSAPLAILASASPRRGAILRAAGVDFLTIVPAIDDADAPADGRDPERYVMSLAWFKARQVLAVARERLGNDGPRWIIAADTMCVHGGEVIGKPSDAAHAERMLRAFGGRMHEVVTGICIVDRADGSRRIFADAARVELGALPEPMLAAHLAAGAWRGKAGGYNYADCVDAGWPLRCDGDPETVMGLPSRLVLPELRGGAAA